MSQKPAGDPPDDDLSAEDYAMLAALFAEDREELLRELAEDGELAAERTLSDELELSDERGLADEHELVAARALGGSGQELPGAREVIGAGFTHREAARRVIAGEPGWDEVQITPRAAGPALGFAAGKPLDVADPDPVLATFAQEVLDDGLAGVSDDELIGLLCAARRMTSWQAAIELTVAAELDGRRRRDAALAKPGAGESSRVSDHVAAELAAALTLTSWAADDLLGLATQLARLPSVRAALMAGEIDLAKARVFAAELSALDDRAANEIAGEFLRPAMAWTTSELRRALRAAVLAHDPEAGKRRARKARQDARVEAWQEPSGNGAITGRELPAAEAIAADQRISELARALKGSGATGTMDQLRAEVFMALLLGRDLEAMGSVTEPGSAGGSMNTAAALRLGGGIHLTLPAATWLGLSDRPGELPGLGPIDGITSRELADLMVRHGKPEWHVTLTNDQGQAVAHACPPSQPPLRASPENGAPVGGGPGPPGRSDKHETRPPPDPRIAWLASLRFAWLEQDPCGHSRQTPAYQPGRVLRHLLAVRNSTCVRPGCRRPARQCDNEHTVPFDQGGKTCECNCGAMCRRDHQTKQSNGWTVTQIRPGTFAWTTPSGRTYFSQPDTYPV